MIIHYFESGEHRKEWQHETFPRWSNLLTNIDELMMNEKCTRDTEENLVQTKLFTSLPLLLYAKSRPSLSWLTSQPPPIRLQPYHCSRIGWKILFPCPPCLFSRQIASSPVSPADSRKRWGLDWTGNNLAGKQAGRWNNAIKNAIDHVIWRVQKCY